MKEKIIELLYSVECKGDEDFGNCPYRVGNMCSKVLRLEYCVINAIAEFLLTEGVDVPSQCQKLLRKD